MLESRQDTIVLDGVDTDGGTDQNLQLRQRQGWSKPHTNHVCGDTLMSDAPALGSPSVAAPTHNNQDVIMTDAAPSGGQSHQKTTKKHVGWGC
jgi:hypothetical protein